MSKKQYIDMNRALKRSGWHRGLNDMLLATFAKSIDIQSLKDSISSGENKKTMEIVEEYIAIADRLSLPAFFNQSTILLNRLNAGECTQADISEFEEVYEKTKKEIDGLHRVCYY